MTKVWNTSFAADSRSRSEEHTSELQSLMRISYAVFCLKKKTKATLIDDNTKIAMQLEIKNFHHKTLLLPHNTQNRTDEYMNRNHQSHLSHNTTKRTQERPRTHEHQSICTATTDN